MSMSPFVVTLHPDTPLAGTVHSCPYCFRFVYFVFFSFEPRQIRWAFRRLSTKQTKQKMRLQKKKDKIISIVRPTWANIQSRESAELPNRLATFNKQTKNNNKRRTRSADRPKSITSRKVPKTAFVKRNGVLFAAFYKSKSRINNNNNYHLTRMNGIHELQVNNPSKWQQKTMRRTR